MKIEYLEIKNYKQFSDLTLDLTYPKGHKKEGEPLDKICIIGQSGTGKTNLLEIIRDKLHTTEVKTVFIEDENSSSEKIYFSKVEKSFNRVENKKIEMSLSDENLLEELEDKKSRLVFEEVNSIPADRHKSFEEKKFEGIMNSLSSFHTESAVIKKHQLLNSAIRKIKDKYATEEIVINYNSNTIELNENSWKLLKEKIDNYTNKHRAYKIKLYDESIKDPNYFKQSIIDMKKWEEENENILEKISDDINRIINRFNLELKINEDTNSYDELLIKDLSNGNIINYDDVSTGTKNLVSTLIPLDIYRPEDSIILIDEPEMSFYPDIQKELIDLYVSVGTNNQLVVATHSPIIASSFEPWEVVELNFDKNNQIYRKKYYEGNENHVNNYTIDPRMLTWTGILTDIFDLEEDSNFIFREKKLMEYAMLKNKIETISDIEEKEKLFKELQKIGKQLGLYNQ